MLIFSGFYGSFTPLVYRLLILFLSSRTLLIQPCQQVNFSNTDTTYSAISQTKLFRLFIKSPVFKIIFFVMLIDLPVHLTWTSKCHYVCRYILCHNRTCSDHRITTTFAPIHTLSSIVMGNEYMPSARCLG